MTEREWLLAETIGMLDVVLYALGGVVTNLRIAEHDLGGLVEAYTAVRQMLEGLRESADLEESS